ncbi:DUF5675 family protein [Flavobacterium sp. UBA6135]|uniref:DUF5675 family protein n=1 Tax=Flavobacterium sp. UBA6135 TaxID=1946553 RepID=UPI0025C4CDA1|nr:DUF5675 family protein [Flavobacterium sp. UBA6135]
MDLVLERIYFPEGTNGMLTVNGTLICYTIELPDQGNQRGISCVPEGKYLLRRRYSTRFQHHLELVDVPERNFILIHSANDALRELRGCIAPVTTLTAPGNGVQFRKAFEKLMEYVGLAMDSGVLVYLEITT